MDCPTSVWSHIMGIPSCNGLRKMLKYGHSMIKCVNKEKSMMLHILWAFYDIMQCKRTVYIESHFIRIYLSQSISFPIAFIIGTLSYNVIKRK